MKQTITRLAIIFAFFAIINPQCKKSNKAVNKPKPVLTSVSPAEGIIGDPVTIQGQDLENTDKVTFNGIESKIIQTTNSNLFTVVPPNATPGTNKIAVHTDGGGSNELSFEVFKEPDHVDPAPPTLSKVLPSQNYTEYPILLYGDNLSGVVKLTFNDKDAVIYTNNKKVITTSIPKDLAGGPVTVKVTTLKGTSSINLQVLGAPPSGPPSVNFTIISIPPPNYIPSISNKWSCGLFAQVSGTNTFYEFNSDTTGNGDYAITGRFEYDFDKTHNYNDLNYVEIINHSTQDTLVGQFSSKFNNPCIFDMVLLSAKTGEIFECTFNNPNTPCDQ